MNKVNSLKISKNEEEKVNVVHLEERGPKNICSVKGLVDKKPLKIGLDCGATISVMNHMTAIKNNIEIFRSDLKIRPANGNISHISGNTKPLEVDINGNKCFLEFLVFDHDVLFGLDWFNKTECGIFPSQGILKFKNDYVYEQENIEYFDNKTIDIFHTDAELSKDYYWDMSYLEMVSASDLNAREKLKFNSLTKEAKGLSARNINELGKFSVSKHKIRLINDDIAPIYTPPYRISQNERNFLKDEVDKMLKAN